MAKTEFIIRDDDIKMDIDSIRLFVVAADQLNISAAGRQLGLAPAVASARLAKLERALGADLLGDEGERVGGAADNDSAAAVGDLDVDLS